MEEIWQNGEQEIIRNVSLPVSGESIRFLRSGSGVIIFHSDTLEFRGEQLFKKETEAGYRLGEATVILKTKLEPFVTVDSLIFQNGCWHGPYLNHLQQGKLKTLSGIADPEDALHYAALASMTDFEPDFDDVKQMTEIYKGPVHYKRKFLEKQLRKILLSCKPSRGLILLRDTGGLSFVLPELARTVGLTQNRYHSYDVFLHSVYTCDAIEEKNLTLRLAALLHDTGKADTRYVKEDGEASFHNHEVFSARHTEKIMKRMNLDKETSGHVCFLVRNHMFHYTEDWTDRAVRRFLSRVDVNSLEDLITLRIADRKGSGKRSNLPRAILDLKRHIDEVRRQESELKIKDLTINGHDLMNMGFEAGPRMGAVMKELLQKVKDGIIANEREILLAEAMQWMEKTSDKTILTNVGGSYE